MSIARPWPPHPRASTAKERRFRNALNYGDLLNLAAASFARTFQPPRFSASMSPLRGRFQDTDPSGRNCSLLQLKTSSNGMPAGEARAAPPKPGGGGWRTSPSAPVLSSWSAPQAIHLPLPRRYRDLQHRPRQVQRPRRARGPAAMNFRSVPALCDWANTVFRAQFPPSRPLTPASPLPDPSKPQGGIFTLTHGCLTAVTRQPRCGQGRALSRWKSMPAAEAYDFLILTRRRRAGSLPTPAPRGAEHPVEVSGAGAWRVGRVATLTALLRALGPAGRAARRGLRTARHQRSGTVRVQAVRRLVQHLPRATSGRRGCPRDSVSITLDAHAPRWRRARPDPRAHRLPRTCGDNPRRRRGGRPPPRPGPRPPGRGGRRQPQ